ncbi:ABC transporter substrate-binding protein [Sphingosinicellaceae bacterium]|nr:ABC transporter substrate-binding protein [Sphingosinicellaceae bacterium]
MRNTLIALALLAALPAPAAAASDPVAPIAAFDDALLASMKAGKATPLPARTAKLLAVVKATHDLPAMAALVVGPAWAATSAGDRAALVEAFARHSAVQYAANFASYAGERFVVDPAVVTRGTDRVVKTTIAGNGTPTPLAYRLRESGGGWKIVDIFAEGVSQIAVQRSEFASTIKAGGVAALTKKLNTADEARLKGR